MTTREDLLRGSCYKSLETDEEFLARLYKANPWWSSFGARGAGLDELAWISFQMQRRIVERIRPSSEPASPRATY